jgi:competence protein ComEC
VRLAGSWLRLRTESGRWPAPAGRTGLVVEARSEPGGRDTAPGAATPRETDLSWPSRLRVRASRRLADRLPADVRPTARALLLAERDELPAEVRRRFADAGLAHLLAISGMHVGILAAVVLALVSTLAPGRIRPIVAAGLVGAYVLVIGAPAPAARAGLLFGGWAWGRSRGRPLRPGDLIGAAALVALVSRPALLVEPGFQLSFAGFGGVALGGSAVAPRRAGPGGRRAPRSASRNAGRRLAVLAAAGTGAFLATAPIAAAHFGRVAPVSILSHFAGTPLVGLAVVGLCASMLPGFAAGIGADAATWAIRVLHSAAGALADLPGAHGDAAPPDLVHWLAWAAGWVAVARWSGTGRPIRALVPAAVAVFLLLSGPAVGRLRPPGPVLLCTLAVGQGDAALLRTPARRWIVFDGGPASAPGAGRETLSSGLLRRRARSVALAVLSHPDLDHLGGLETVLAEMPVGGLLDSGDPLPRPAYARLLATLDARGIPWVEGRAGTRLVVDGVDLLVLGPPARGGPGARTEPGPLPGAGTGAGRPAPGAANATSLVVRVAVGGFRYLNTGDATREEEAALLRAWPAESLRADLLKVGHHGSRTSTSSAWLGAVRPALAVISAGPGNRYGHPHAEVLRELARSGVADVWRTDHDGTLCVEVEPDGRWRKRGDSAWREPGVVGRRSGTEIEAE